MGQRPEQSEKVGLPLFDIRARTGHPASSGSECRRMNEDLSAALQRALDAVRRFEGHTARTIEKLAGLQAGEVWKYAAQLERRNLITRIRKDTQPMKLYPKK